MKIQLIINLLLAWIIITSCEKENGQQNEDTHNQVIDSIIYSIYLHTFENDIIAMEKYLDNELVENIILNYNDSIVIKEHFVFDTLSKKSIYHFKGNQYAAFSIDSFFSEEKYFKTYYTYDNQGYLIEEKHIPGISNICNDTCEYTEIEYYISGGNSYKDTYIVFPPNVASTGFNDYTYTDKELKLDIIDFKNSIIGEQNKNLPSAFGYKMDIKPGTFYEKIKYEYEVNEGIVSKRIDSYIESDTINRKEILVYSYD